MKNVKIIKAVAIVLCLLLVAGLSVTLGIFASRVDAFKREMGAVYDQAYYAVLDSLGDTENKLRKVQVSSYAKTKKELLTEVYKNCEVMSVSLARLNGEEFNSTSLLKFANQLGGFSNYLAKKLPDEDITDEENVKLSILTDIVTAIEKAFSEAGEAVATGGSLYGKLSEGISVLQGVYDAFNATGVDYPEMIYDGPFSEGLLDREAKFLSDKEEVDVATVTNSLAPFFGTAEYSTNVSGSLESYQFNVEGGSVQVTKKGGYIVVVARDKEVGEKTLTKEQAVEVASTFLTDIGYADMQAVWATENQGLAYINFAYSSNDIVYYPDLVKVKVDLTDGQILGLEAENYLYNHVEREPFGEVANAEGITLKEGFRVDSTRLTVIPTEWNTEILAYEVAGEYGGSVYYIYFDAKTLAEVRVMRVIADEMQGELIV